MNTEAQISLDNIEELIGYMEDHVTFIHKKIKNFVENENKRVDNIIKLRKISEKKVEKDKIDDEINKNDEYKKKIIDLMDIEEKNEKSLNILEYKK